MTTFFETMEKSYVDVTVNEQGINTLEFLQATESLIKMFDVLGNPAFVVVQNDLTGNVKKIRDRYEAAPAVSGTIEQLVMNEKNEKKKTATEGLLWLLRGLKFTQVALTRSVQDGNEELAVSFTKAYEETLKKYHNFIVKGVFAVAMKGCPYRAVFYEKLGPKAEVDKHLPGWVAALGKQIAQLEAFLESGNYTKGM